MSIVVALAIASAAWAKGELPRKYHRFELGLSMGDLAPDLAAFKCSEFSEAATECSLNGFPKRDDFMILRFYKKKLASVAHYTFGADFEKMSAKYLDKLGKPTMPEYKSDVVLTYIWRDEKTFITLTNFMAKGCVVYEVRDVESEPFFRKAFPK